MGRFRWLLCCVLFSMVFVCAGGLFTAYSQDNIFNDVDIVFFTGGPKGGSFGSVVESGARMAEKNLGARVRYVYSDWSNDKMISQFKEAINESPAPDGIAIMGHPGYEGLKDLVKKAINKGIIVTVQNVDIPELRAKYFDKGFGYVGQDLHSSGYILGEGAARKYNLRTGDEAIVIGPPGETRGERTQGCVDGLVKSGITVKVVGMPAEVNANPGKNGKAFFKETLDKYPKAKLMVIDHGSATAVSPEILKALGKKPGEIKVAGFDLSPATLAGIKEGYIGLVHDQQPFLQGYLPIVQICMTKKFKLAGLYIDTGVGLVDDSNVAFLENLVIKKIR